MKMLKIGTIAAMFIGLGVSLGQSAMAGDVQLCRTDQPCFNAAYQSGNQIIFEFNGVRGWDFYNVRYRVRGGGEKQVKNRSGQFKFNNVLPNHRYTLSVQGCNTGFLGLPSSCSPWNQQTVTTK